MGRQAVGASDVFINNSFDPTPAYNYRMHCTGDIQTATFRVGDTLVYDRGHLTALDHPAARAVVARYPDRPGLGPEPRSYYGRTGVL